MTKPETVAQLKRKIERLEARLAALTVERSRHLDIYSNNLYSTVDLQIRIKQAVEILTGEG